MSHPSLGRPPLDPTAGHPAAAGRIRADRDRLATRSLETALADTRGMRARYDEPGLRYLLHVAGLLAEQVAVSLAAGEPDLAREYAESTAPVYRRRKVPMDDVVGLCEGLRGALPMVLAGDEMAEAGAAIDAAVAAYRWHRRIAGDGRKRNALLQLLYKGA